MTELMISFLNSWQQDNPVQSVERLSCVQGDCITPVSSSRLIRIFHQDMSFTCTSSVGRGQGDVPIQFQKRFSRSYAEIPLGIQPSNPAPEGNYPEPMAIGGGENRDPSAIHVLSVR